MAERAKPSEGFLKYFRDCYNNFPLEDPTKIHENACPVIIQFCDASAYARRFSEAVVEVETVGGLPLSYLFRFGHDQLVQYVLGLTEKRSEAISRLENFVANIEKHTDCLKCLFNKTEREQNGIKNEHQVQVIIAVHLFEPLAGDNSCTIGSQGFSKDVRACPVCKQDITAMLGNTSLGNGNAWHGYADLFVRRSIVKLDMDTNYESDSCEASGDTGGPSRYECCSYESGSIVGVKKDGIDSFAISQGLAQTIVNAYCEIPKIRPLLKTFVPSFIASSQHVKITMYSCGLDILMMSPDLNLFVKKKSVPVPVLDLSTILSIWCALNFEMNVNNHEVLALIPVSKFKEMAGLNLYLYEDQCFKPMKVKEDLTPIQFHINDDFLDLVSEDLNEVSKRRKRMKEFLNN